MSLAFRYKQVCLAAFTLTLGANAIALSLNDYTNPKAPCFPRATSSHLTVADTHIHFRPFSGPSVSYQNLLDEIRKNGVLFPGVMGIGQRLPNGAIDENGKECESYRDCKGVPARPTVKNDLVNAANYVEFKAPGMKPIFHMTFPDLADPADILTIKALYDKEYPDMFKAMGESNVVKQALFPNLHAPVTTQQIDSWSAFMPALQASGMPLFLHADLGSDQNPHEYLPLIQYILNKYPNNKIVWLHLGISGELTTIAPTDHIAILTQLLESHPNLYVDTSWRVLEDSYFSKYRAQYVAFLNRYSSRIITGSDYVAYKNKAPAYNYTDELKASSEMNKYVDDAAFRNIALGQTYLTMLGMTDTYNAPPICGALTK
ncbi:MAG: amidohydrolase [Glaciimonas sp.]|nr:amidohydrolase [Glaciimonas sp.]